MTTGPMRRVRRLLDERSALLVERVAQIEEQRARGETSATDVEAALALDEIAFLRDVGEAVAAEALEPSIARTVARRDDVATVWLAGHCSTRPVSYP